MLEDMEDGRGARNRSRSCVWVLMTRSRTGFTVLNPAYRNPDRRGRAEVTRGYRDDRGWKRLIKHADIHLRIGTLIAEAGRKLRAATETIEDGKGCRFYDLSLLYRVVGATPSRGVGPKSRGLTSNNHLSRGIIQ
jgi:hypothetical protein